jgi:hypothetical protein
MNVEDNNQNVQSGCYVVDDNDNTRWISSDELGRMIDDYYERQADIHFGCYEVTSFGS